MHTYTPFNLSIWLVIIAVIGLTNISQAKAESPFTIDFSDASGDVKSWFKRHGWSIKGNINNMQARFENGKLVLEPTADDYVLFGKQLKEGQQLKGNSQIKINWGVEQYPDGANWGGDINKKRPTRQAISVIASFGTEKNPSGSFFIPDVPYFIGLFLGKNEKAGTMYYGNYHKKGGRYFCEPCNGQTSATTTIFDYGKAFSQSFGFAPPPISSIAIEVDVSGIREQNGTYSKAYIEKISIGDF